MTKKVISLLLSIFIIASVIIFSFPSTVFAANVNSQADAATEFTFNDGKMSKEVLRSYVSRAVTHQGFCVEKNANPLFDEDLRFLRRIGAKYIGRSAMLSWVGNLTLEEIENHFKIAEEAAEKAHKADPEMILQAGIFETAYKGTVSSIKIPEYVFEAFGVTAENRNFSWEKIVFPEGEVAITGKDIGIGCWGYEDSGVPDIRQLETKMYFYYMITRYIDAGYEAFHMGQAEMMMRYDSSNSAHWQTLLDKARAYAKKHARRGVALFDCHTAIDSSGIKVGDRLIFDVQGAGMCPNETSKEKDALKAEVLHYKELVPNRDDGLSWVGRSAGGIHPLGFEIEENFTLIEFDNYGGNGMPGIATPTAFYNWGFDDVTWFATQPEWYRNQFLTETAEYLSNNELCLDTEGKQQYFLQPVTMRVITPGSEEWYPKVTYTMGEKANDEFIFSLIKRENAKYDINNDGTFTITISRNYRANRNSDGCPLGFNQEDTIRKIFLGENAPEDDELLKVVLPQEYGGTDDTVITPSLKEPQKDTANIDNNITSDMPFGTVGTVLMWVLVGIAGVSLICAVVFSIYVLRMNKKKT